MIKHKNLETETPDYPVAATVATPSEKLADSLAALKTLQDQHVIAIRSEQLSRTHRERLLKNGFIREVIKGWYMPSPP